MRKARRRKRNQGTDTEKQSWRDKIEEDKQRQKQTERRSIRLLRS